MPLCVDNGDIVLDKGLDVDDKSDGNVSKDALVSVVELLEGISEGVVDEPIAPTDDEIEVLN